MYIWISDSSKTRPANSRYTVLTVHVTADSGNKFDLSLGLDVYNYILDMVLDFSDWSKDYLQKEEVMRFESMSLSRLKRFFPS